MHIDNLTLEQSRNLLHQLGSIFGIGMKARTASVLLVNAGNAVRRSECLWVVEDRHTVEVEDEETGETIAESLLNWGATPQKFKQQYRSALRFALEDGRYAHGEIEAACGGEIALQVQDAVLRRRARIDSEMAAAKSA